MATVTVPSFRFAVFFYAEILSELRAYLRINVPELSTENDYELAVQMLKSFALVGHLNSVHTDAAANEAVFGTAKLLESVRQHLKLIGVEPDTATPAVSYIFARLTKVFDATTEVIPPYSQFATAPTADSVGVVFEYNDDDPLEVSRTDQLSAVFADNGGTFTDYTTEAVSGASWSPWPTVEAQDAVYFGHDSIIFSGFVADVDTAGADYDGVWEFYAGSLGYPYSNPSDVTDLGSTLRFDLDGTLGSSKATGSLIRVQYNPTGAYEDVESQWDGVHNYIETSTLLGQSSPSTEESDYTVGSEWLRVFQVSDESSGFKSDGDGEVFFSPGSYVLPYIQPGTVNGVEAYWFRYRVTEVGGAPTGPDLQEIALSSLYQIVRFEVTQGQRIVQEPLASGTGTATQQYTLARTSYIGGTLLITVDPGTGAQDWEEVDNFLNSTSTDRHFTVEVGQDDIVLVTFGNGDNGAIPPVGSVINAYYRIGADVDGNVATGSITINRSGVPYLGDLTSGPGVGWKPARGSDAEDLEKLKIEGPAEIRTLGKAVTVDDFSVVSLDYQNSLGAKPISRAYAIFEELGPKTVGLHLVASGGNFLTADVLEDVEKWYNGDDDLDYDTRVLMGYQVGAQNYRRKTITVEATVKARGVTQGQIKAALQTFLNPLATHDDGVTWRWDFGEKVPTSKIIGAIDGVAPDKIEEVTLTVPASDVYLDPDELPWTTDADLTVTVVD